MKRNVSDFNERFNRWKNGESYWDLRNIKLNQNNEDVNSSVRSDFVKSYVDDYFRNYDNGKDGQLVEYIKTIENPDSVGYDSKTNTWSRVQSEGFDPNTYGYGLDHRYFDKSVLNDDGSMDHDVMLNQVNKKLKYYEDAAKRNGVDKNKMSNDDYLLSIGAMYRGDAKDVYNAAAKYNILKPGEFKKEIYNKYKQQGLNERIKQSEKFFKNKKQDNSFIKNYNLIDDLKKQNAFIPKFDNGKTGYVRQNNNPIMFDNQGNLVDQVTGEKGTMLIPNVTIKPKRKSNYSSAFDGSLWNFVDVTNALSGGILNRMSPSQNIRAGYDFFKYLKGDIDRSKLTNSVIYGNNGIVSDNFSKNNPITSSIVNMASDVFMPYSLYKGLKLGKQELNNIERRAIETAMRTSNKHDGLSNITKGIKNIMSNPNDNKKRIFSIAKYIISGKKTGPKGYYNSFSNIDDAGRINYYDGFENSYDKIDGNDIIDAFLYKKPIDKRYGLKLSNDGYGPHSKYVLEKYKNKDIPVYKIDRFDDVSTEDVIPLSQWEGQDRPFPETTTGKILDAGGHLIQNGVYDDAYHAVRVQDIWKFNPDEYIKKYFRNNSKPTLKQKLIKKGLQEVDRLGTPIITKTNWFIDPEDIAYYNSGKSIHIKKENRGKFTQAANRNGMSVQSFATKVLNAPKGKYSSTLRKRANFAKNAAKWHK